MNRDRIINWIRTAISLRDFDPEIVAHIEEQIPRLTVPQLNELHDVIRQLPITRRLQP